jgi:dynein heavy chain
MRALRDFNLPKIAFADLDIFYGLLGDLFPKIEIERKRDMDFEKIISDCTVESLLHPHESFILKIVQLK